MAKRGSGMLKTTASVKGCSISSLRKISPVSGKKVSQIILFIEGKAMEVKHETILDTASIRITRIL